MPRKKKYGPSPADLIKPDASLEDLRKSVQLCRGCDIWERATQAVFGEGPPAAEVMLVGEQPGNREDIEAHLAMKQFVADLEKIARHLPPSALKRK